MKDIWKYLPDGLHKTDKKVYIYGFNSKSLSIFAMTLNENIYVTSFIRDKNVLSENQVDVIFKKKVIDPEEIQENSILLCPADEAENSGIISLKEKAVEIYPVEIQKLNEVIENNEVIIYGVGVRGKRTAEYLIENGVKVIGFADSDKSKIGNKVEIENSDSLEILDINCFNKDTPVVISSGYYKEIHSALVNKKFKNIYVDYSQLAAGFYPYIIIKNNYDDFDDMVWNIRYNLFDFYRDIYEKKIIIYGYNELGKDLIRILSLLDKKIEYCIDDKIESYANDFEVKNIYDILYEDLSDKMVIICNLKKNGEKNYDESSIDKLLSMGLVMHENFITIDYRISPILKHKSVSDKNSYYAKDPLLTFTLHYPKTSDIYKQYIVYGNVENAKKKIVTLGGSTTDGGIYHHIKSWPEFLSEKFSDAQVAVYNGGISAYTSRQECLKLLRDIAQLNPDIVISYSGVNDIQNLSFQQHPFVHYYFTQYSNYDEVKNMEYGMENSSEDPLSLWLRMEQTMQAISNLYGSKFIGILQPNIFCKDTLTLKEKTYFLFAEYINEIKIKISDICHSNKMFMQVKDMKEFQENSSLYDFSEIFKDNTEEIFMDWCHVHERGNEIIADKIYDIIMKNGWLDD